MCDMIFWTPSGLMGRFRAVCSWHGFFVGAGTVETRPENTNRITKAEFQGLFETSGLGLVFGFAGSTQILSMQCRMLPQNDWSQRSQRRSLIHSFRQGPQCDTWSGFQHDKEAVIFVVTFLGNNGKCLACWTSRKKKKSMGKSNDLIWTKMEYYL